MTDLQELKNQARAINRLITAEERRYLCRQVAKKAPQNVPGLILILPDNHVRFLEAEDLALDGGWWPAIETQAVAFVMNLSSYDEPLIRLFNLAEDSELSSIFGRIASGAVTPIFDDEPDFDVEIDHLADRAAARVAPGKNSTGVVQNG